MPCGIIGGCSIVFFGELIQGAFNRTAYIIEIMVIGYYDGDIHNLSLESTN